MTQIEPANSYCNMRKLALCFAFAMVAILVTPDAANAVVSPIGMVLCNVVNIIMGNFGRALATLAIISLGIGAMMGKVSWGLGLTVSGGIAVIFNAGAILNLLTGQGVFC